MDMQDFLPLPGGQGARVSRADAVMKEYKTAADKMTLAKNI